MTIVYRYLLLVLFMFFAVSVKTQTRFIDSLKQYVHHAKNNDEKLEAIIVLCNEYKSITRDTLDYYAFMARELAAKTNNSRLKQMAELAVAYDYARWGWADSTIYTVDPLIAANKVIIPEQRGIYFKASRLKAMTYASHSRFQDALSILYKIIGEAEAYKDSLTLSENLNSIGSIAIARDNARDALTWLSRALAVTGNDKRFNEIKAGIFVNLADAYHQSGKVDSAIVYSKKGVELFKQTGNIINLALTLQKQSSIFTKAGKFAEAEAALKEMIGVRKTSGDGNMYTDDNISLAEFYLQTNQVKKAIQLCKNVLQTGDVHIPLGEEQSYTNAITLRLEYYKMLARCYKTEGDNTQYQHMLEQIIVAKDSLYEYNSAQAIAELQTKYEVQKKENTIIQQKLDITRKNNRFYTLLGIAFFSSIIAWLMFTGYKKREKIKLNAMLEKEKDIAAQSIATAEENERKRIAADLHDNLGAYAASIVSNLDIIEPVATGDAPNTQAIEELRNNSQAIVSQLNDTIWALKKDALSLTSISDRIKIFIQRIQNSYPAVTINVTEKIEEDLMLTPSHAFHLFRIVQEAVNNALRHSRGKKVEVIIESNTTKWRVTIADDGTGIQQQRNDGNGLLNMKARAKETGWNIAWHSSCGLGTGVVISPTTN
ncbi:MAG: sensor histidine kinase [Agriterribacter sp.]